MQSICALGCSLLTCVLQHALSALMPSMRMHGLAGWPSLCVARSGSQRCFDDSKLSTPARMAST